MDKVIISTLQCKYIVSDQYFSEGWVLKVANWCQKAGVLGGCGP